MKERKFKCGNDIVTVTMQKSDLLICETTNEEYNEANTDGYWIATEEDVKREVDNNNWVLI